MSNEERWRTLGRGKRTSRKSSLPYVTKISVRHLRADDIDLWRQMAALAGLSSVGELVYHAMRALHSNPQWKQLMVESVNNFRALVNSELTTALTNNNPKMRVITPDIAREYLERAARVAWGENEVRLLKLLLKAKNLEAMSGFKLSADDLKTLRRWSALGLWTVDSPSGSGRLRITPYGREIIKAALGVDSITHVNDEIGSVVVEREKSRER